MASKDLINLGYSPDSGTGDSARRGGEKINNLFADVYTQMGDNPVGQDPSQPFYGYRRPFYEYEYKVGELHPAGRFVPVTFKTTNSATNLYNSTWGYGYDATGNLVDTDGDGIPDIYRDSEWYFLSRGEQIDADFSGIDSDSQVHFVLPIGVPGDQIIVRDGFGTWNNTLIDKGIHVSIWTTPFDFQSLAQVQEWEKATGVDGTDLDSDTLAIYSPVDGASFKSNWHRVVPDASIQALYPRLAQPFAVSRTTNPFDGLSPTYLVNQRRVQLEFLFSNYNEGWVMRVVILDAADVGTSLLQFGNRLDAIDSDLSVGLYVSADSDIRHTVPIFRRTSDGREIHGNLSLRGDADAIMTTIDSEDTPLSGETNQEETGAQPLTTTIRFKLRDDVKVKNNVFVGNDLEVGHHLQVGETLTIDSDLAYFNNRLQVHEKATFDSDVLISGELEVLQQSFFRNDVRIDGNLFIGGDATAIETESLRVSDNLITLSKDANGAPLTDTGVIFQRYDQTLGVNGALTATDAIYNPFMIWNEADDKFKFGETVSSDSDAVLVADRTYLALGRGEFVLYDSENTPRVVFEKATGWPDAVRGVNSLLNPNERPTVEPDYEFHVKANAVFGRDSDDVVVFNSRIMSNFVPFGDERYNLGDSDNKWKDLYLSGNTIYLGSIALKDENGKLVIVDSDGSFIDLTGADFTTDNLVVDSDMSVGGNSLLLGELHVQEHAQFDSDVVIAGNLTVGDHVTLGGHVKMLESLTVDSDVRFGADLRVDSDVYIKGDVEIREDLVVIGELNVDDNVYFGHKLTVDSDVVFGSDLRVDSDVIIKGRLTVGEQVRIDDTLYVADNATFDSDVNINGILDVDNIQSNNGTVITFHDDVIFRENVFFDSDVRIGNDLRVDSDLIVKGELYVGENVQIHDTLYVKGHATFDSDVTIAGGVSFGREVTFEDDVLFLDNATFDSDVNILGSLTVNGQINFVNSQNLAVSDTFITVNKGQASPFNDTGIIFSRFDSDSVSAANYNTILEWDETFDKFVLGETDNSGITNNPTITKTYMSVSGIQTQINGWFETLNDAVVRQKLTVDSDLVVSGTVSIPGYVSVSHHLGTLDSDLLKVQQRLDSDETALQALRLNIATDSDAAAAMPLDGKLKIIAQDPSINTYVDFDGINTTVRIEVKVVDGGSY